MSLWVLIGNIDIDWETSLEMVVNKHVKATIATHFIYDNDVKFKEDTNGDGELETLSSLVLFSKRCSTIQW